MGRPHLASQSVEVGGKVTPLKATPMASIVTPTGGGVIGEGDAAIPARGGVAADHSFLSPVQTSTHTVAATASMPQRCNRTPARAATAVDISPAMVDTAVDTPFDFTTDAPSIPPVPPPPATWDCCGMTHLTATRSWCGKCNKWMVGKIKPHIRKYNGKAEKGANKMEVKGKVAKKKGVAKYPASQIALSPAGTQISGLTMDEISGRPLIHGPKMATALACSRPPPRRTRFPWTRLRR